MSDLQCAATLLLVPYGKVEDLVRSVAGTRIAYVWTTTTEATLLAAEAVAADLGVGVAQRSELRDPALLDPTLGEIADEHRGETVVVVVDHGDAIVEVTIDGDGMVSRRR